MANLSIGYDKPLISNINMKMRGFEKIGIIGNNGTGKTTLIKTILGEIEPLSGDYQFLKEMKIGYFDQNLSNFNPELNLIETIHGIYPQKTLYEVRSDLAKVEFTGEDVFKKVRVLSGGELVKLQILLLMLERPDILILDEPTNHLDIDSKNVIEDIFEEYDGPIIFISHDRYFINKVASKIIKLDTEMHIYDGNYEEYLHYLEKHNQKVEKTKTKSSNKKEDLEKLKKKLLGEIEKLEKDLQDLHQSLFLSDIYTDVKKYRNQEQIIKEKELELENLYFKLEELDILTQ
jgi:ATP-binding cassette subfamily F protein 3